MNLNKRSYYYDFKEFSDLLNEDTVIYIKANNKKELKKKQHIINEFCSQKNINPKKIYLAVTNNSNLMNKPNLQKLLDDEENLDIITFSTSDIYRYATDDYYDIKRFLRESNLGIYDLNYESFSIERQPLLYWLGN